MEILTISENPCFSQSTNLGGNCVRIWKISRVNDWYHRVEEILNYGMRQVPSSSDKYFAGNEPVLSKFIFSMARKNATVSFTARLKNMCWNKCEISVFFHFSEKGKSILYHNITIWGSISRVVFASNGKDWLHNLPPFFLCSRRDSGRQNWLGEGCLKCIWLHT